MQRSLPRWVEPNCRMATWIVYEYSRLYRDQQTRYSADKLLLKASQFDALKQLISIAETDHNILFRYGIENGREVLVCQNYVGVICLSGGDQLEILPKTRRYRAQQPTMDQTGVDQAGLNPSVVQDRLNLIKMLKATRYLPSKSAAIANLDISKMTLLEVFVRQFLEQLNPLVKRGIARQYRSVEENLGYMKGRLKVAEQLRYNLVAKHRSYVEFDELSQNRAENRLIRSALLWVQGRVRGETSHLCQQLLFHFAAIPSSASIARDMREWQGSRHLRHYEAVRPWLEMIFNEQSPTSVAGAHSMLSLLFPMERVFESYVAQRLSLQFPQMKIRTQVATASLVRHLPRGASTEQQLFRLRPDLYLLDEDRVIIADTKWKLIDESLPNKKYRISEADIYQMLAYNQVYQQGQKVAEIWLIYPASEKFSAPLPDFKFNNGLRIRVLPFDIAMGGLKLA